MERFAFGVKENWNNSFVGKMKDEGQNIWLILQKNRSTHIEWQTIKGIIQQ